MGELAALGAALAVAVSNILNKFLTGRIAPVPLNAIRTVGAAAFLLAMFFALGKYTQVDDLPLGPLMLILSGGLVTSGFGDTAFLFFIRRVDISKATPLAFSLLTMMMVVSGVIVLDEEVSYLTLIGGGLVIAGIYLLTGRRREGKERSVHRSIGVKGLGLVFMAVFFQAAGLTMMREGLRDVDAVSGNTIRMLGMIVFFLIAVVVLQGRSLRPEGTSPIWVRRRNGGFGGLIGLSKEVVQGGVEHQSKLSGPNPLPSLVEKGGRTQIEGFREGSSERVKPPQTRPQRRRGAIDWPGVVLAAIAGALSLGIGATLLFYAFQQAGAAVSTILLNSQLIWITPLSMLFLKERIDLRTLLGIATCLAGITLVLL